MWKSNWSSIISVKCYKTKQIDKCCLYHDKFLMNYSSLFWRSTSYLDRHWTALQPSCKDTSYLQCESKKVPPCGFLTFFPKRLGIFKQFFTHLLYVPIYARLQIFIQLSATLTKLCHIKRDHPVHIICSMSTICQNARIQMFAKVVDSFVDRCLRQVITDLLQCTF